MVGSTERAVIPAGGAAEAHAHVHVHVHVHVCAENPRTRQTDEIKSVTMTSGGEGEGEKREAVTDKGGVLCVLRDERRERRASVNGDKEGVPGGASVVCVFFFLCVSVLGEREKERVCVCVLRAGTPPVAHQQWSCSRC